MKTLFFFKNNTPIYFEVFANDLQEAQAEIKRLTGDVFTNPPHLTHITQNHSCPKCSCHASECNYQD